MVNLMLHTFHHDKKVLLVSTTDRSSQCIYQNVLNNLALNVAGWSLGSPHYRRGTKRVVVGTAIFHFLKKKYDANRGKHEHINSG